MTPSTIPQAQVDAAMSMLAQYGVPEDKARIALYAAHSAKVPDQSEDKMMSDTPAARWREELDEALGHLCAAVSQSIASDDQIIMDHVRAAYEITKVVRRRA